MNLPENLELDVDFDPLVDAFEKWHDWTIDNPQESEAILLGTSVFAWYAMPEGISSSAVRFVGKSAILGGIGAYYYHLPDSDNHLKQAAEQAVRLWKDNVGHLSTPQQIAIGVGVGAVCLKVNSLVERYILHRGERLKKKGKVLPHVRQGLVLGGITGGLAYWALRNAGK